jgi:hypothetical protein
MRKWIGIAAVTMAGLTGGALWAYAQVQPNNPRPAPPLQVQPPPQIISGADFGFRVDSVAPDGTPSGKIVVRQKGEWVEVRVTAAARRIDVVK